MLRLFTLSFAFDIPPTDGPFVRHVLSTVPAILTFIFPDKVQLSSEPLKTPTLVLVSLIVKLIFTPLTFRSLMFCAHISAAICVSGSSVMVSPLIV